MIVNILDEDKHTNYQQNSSKPSSAAHWKGYIGGIRSHGLYPWYVKMADYMQISQYDSSRPWDERSKLCAPLSEMTGHGAARHLGESRPWIQDTRRDGWTGVVEGCCGGILTRGCGWLRLERGSSVVVVCLRGVCVCACAHSCVFPLLLLGSSRLVHPFLQFSISQAPVYVESPGDLAKTQILIQQPPGRGLRFCASHKSPGAGLKLPVCTR